MSQNDKKDPNSGMEVLFGLIDSLQKHKRKLAQKSDPSMPGEKQKTQTEVHTDSTPFAFPIKTIVAAAVLIAIITFVTLKKKTTDTASSSASRTAVIGDAPITTVKTPVSSAPVNVPTTSAYPRRIMQQPMPVPAHMQVPPDPEEQREREEREREYDRLQNPEFSDPTPPPPAPAPDLNNISN